ncbi:endonuclease domain-containing protein [Pseudonocardia sp. CA-142604]|uniref:endonuclease domain-containing protein n=1 Tax=Pseudonocardia sp. CA-142604 TaxID=3240024 RepID=UPI003D9071B9
MVISGLPDVFRGSDAVACGALTRAQLRGPSVRRICRDVYTVSSGQITHQLRCRAMALSLPAGAVITGRSAATIRGVPLCWPDDDVQVLAPTEMRLGHRAGLDVRRTGIEPVEWEPWAGGRIATPMRLALDLLLGRALPDAVADLDAVLRARLVEHAAVATMVAQRSDNGIVLARRAVELADPRAESLPESKLRVHLVLDGLAPVPQYWIHDAGGRIARVDLALPEHKIAIEYDGDWRDGETWALNRDRDRLNRVHAAGWDVVFVTAPLLRDGKRLLRTIRQAIPS